MRAHLVERLHWRSHASRQATRNFIAQEMRHKLEWSCKMPTRFPPGRDLRRSRIAALRALSAAFKPGGLKVQELPLQELSDEQAHWLKRILETRPKRVLFDQLTIPDAVQDVLVEKGLVRRWRNGAVEITLDGIREVTRRPLTQDGAAETASPRRSTNMTA